MRSPEIPQAYYDLGAAAGLLKEDFFNPPTTVSLILDRLIRSTPGGSGPVSYEELLGLYRTVERGSAKPEADKAAKTNAGQACRYALRRIRALFGEGFISQNGKASHAAYERTEPDEELAERFTPPVIEASIDHASKRHLLAANRSALLTFSKHLFKRYSIHDPLEQEMLETVLLFSGLRFNFSHRNPDTMRARMEALQSVRAKLASLSEEVTYVKDGKRSTKQRVNPVGAINTSYFARPELLAKVEGFLPLEEIVRHHRARFGNALPVDFLSRPEPALSMSHSPLNDVQFGDPQFSDANALFARRPSSHPSGVELRRFITPSGAVVARRQPVRTVQLPTSAPGPQSPE